MANLNGQRGAARMSAAAGIEPSPGLYSLSWPGATRDCPISAELAAELNLAFPNH